MSEFKLQCLGVMMEPKPDNPQEVEGLLNPAPPRDPDGDLYPFLRLVVIARVRFDEASRGAGDPGNAWYRY
jgi:hypothetical protein